MSSLWKFAGLWLLLGLAGQSEPIRQEQQGANMIEVNRADYAIPLISPPIVDTVKLNQLMDGLAKKVYRKPFNARVESGGNILPERAGAQLNRKAFTEKFYGFFYGSTTSRLEVPVSPIYSKVDSELLVQICERTIGYYVTYFNGGNESRYHNIKLAADAINSYVLFPGETFSFNRVVGMRTVDKGYRRAPVIVKGEFSEGIGGGICQVSSTLFNAVDHAGLQIGARYSHSRRVPYVPPGRDATVSWGGPDFSFTNKYNQPIVIRTFVSRGKLTVTISSSDHIVYKQRNVPSASKVLPEEINADLDANGDVIPAKPTS
ncbi:VanW family protein [Gordoniibacillus kamchatkensis]|uniref:VanW family protein n=1 Tax=Gordoniibacillus kamchatkensis TaxID=1590651 RepID=UPI0006983715|nr:VanW family protein [Paenibacillus sp. VKM B-2647]